MAVFSHVTKHVCSFPPRAKSINLKRAQHMCKLWEPNEFPSILQLYLDANASYFPFFFSFPNKQKSAEPSPTMTSSSLGSNLSELDRLLLELNAVQHTPASGFTAGKE